MYIICANGNANSGKTTLLSDIPQILSGYNSKLINKAPAGLDPLDSRSTYRVDNKIVVITTPGDNEAEMKANIKYVNMHNPDIWVTASRKKHLNHKYEKLVYQAIETFANADQANRHILNLPAMKSFRKHVTEKSKKQHVEYLTKLKELFTRLI